MLTMMVGEGNLDLTCGQYLESVVAMLKSTPTEKASLPSEMLDSAVFYYLDILSITNLFSLDCESKSKHFLQFPMKEFF